MRVCLVAHRFYEVNTHMMQFANALARRGDEVEVISVRHRGLPKHEIVDGVKVYRIQPRTVEASLQPIVYLLTLLRFHLHAALLLAWRHLRKPYQLIHIQSVPDSLVFTAILPKLLGTPVILDLRDLTPELYASKFSVRHDSFVVSLLIRAEKLSAAFADHVIVANPIWYERIVNRSAKRSKCTMIWYYPDPRLFYPHNKQSNGRFVLMYPGTLSWHQGVDIAIRALPRVLREVPSAEFHIYGAGPEKSFLLALTEELGLQRKVKLHKGIPVKKMADLMAESDLGVVPKRASCLFGNEAASTKIPEFMALGVPVVASRTKVETCMYGDRSLCYFQSEDEDDLARAILSIYHQPELRQKLIADGIRYIEQNNRELKLKAYLLLVDSLVLARTQLATNNQPES